MAKIGAVVSALAEREGRGGSDVGRGTRGRSGAEAANLATGDADAATLAHTHAIAVDRFSEV
jgi:hypothetical protein